MGHSVDGAKESAKLNGPDGGALHLGIENDATHSILQSRTRHERVEYVSGTEERV